ncbi:hypothetical protein [Burkholderia cepacia]|uniref:hypothetical protein n=1 Tax=Burkholderia cepacia TaxID=292 RepID=UPI00158F5C9F|nr:hypothetical protein [Burkholderia cepacia]
MKKYLFAAALAIASTSFAQTFKANDIDVGGAVKFSGSNGISITPRDIYNPAIFVGPNAGTNYPKSNPWPIGIGAYSLHYLNQPEAEVTALGTLSCRLLTTGNYNVCLGLHTLGAETTGSGITAVGNDAARNSIGGANYTALGANAGRNGNLDLSTALGAGAIRGNASSITFGGTATPGDVITITFTCTDSPTDCLNSPVSWTYTVRPNDSLQSIASAFVDMINARPVQEVGRFADMQATLSVMPNTPAIVRLDYTGSANTGWKGQITYTVSSGATETLAIGPGTKAQSVVAIGSMAVDGAQAQNLTNSVYIGQGVAPSLINATDNVCVGQTSCYDATTASGVTALGLGTLQRNVVGNFITAVGTYAGQNVTGPNNVLIGANAGQGMTSGFDNVIVGAYSGDTTSRACITTGAGNVQLGRLSCVGDPTAFGQLSIQNIIFGVGNNGGGSTISTGNIGIGIRNPVTKLDVDGPVRTKLYTVATLPIGLIGMRAFVSDAQACNFASAPSGGGTLGCPVYFDGTRWVAG